MDQTIIGSNRKIDPNRRAHLKADLTPDDTDLVGTYGYCCDISRTWIIGDVAPNDQQNISIKLPMIM